MAQLRDLRPHSFLTLSLDEAMSIVKEVRFRRRQTYDKVPKVPKVPKGTSTTEFLESLFETLSSEQKAEIAKTLFT